MTRRLLATIATIPLIASAVAAQEPLVTQQAGEELRGDWVIGASVTDRVGDTVGSIEDVIIDPSSGQVSTAVLSVGGFLGFGAKQIGVAWSELQIDWDASEITIDLTREEAEEAPEYQFRDREFAPAPEPESAPMGGAGGMNGDGGGTSF